MERQLIFSSFCWRGLPPTPPAEGKMENWCSDSFLNLLGGFVIFTISKHLSHSCPLLCCNCWRLAVWDQICLSALRQHCRICSYFGWVWQILRQLWRPPESGCGIFEEPQLSENWLQLIIFDGLALLHMSINLWICFWCILFTFQQLRRTFPLAFLYCQLPQIWENTPIGLHKRLNFGKHSHWLAQNWSKVINQ